MLQQMRSSTGSWFAKGILGLLVLSFLGWGVADYTSTGFGSNVAAEVGEREIPYPEFAIAYQNFLTQQRMNQVEPDVAEQMGLAESVLRTMTARAVYEAEAAELGLTASDPMVRQTIESTTAFQDQTGQFSRILFQQILAQNNMTEAEMVESVRRDVARNQLVDAASAGITAPQAMVDRLFAHFGERRSADTLVLPVESVAAPPLPSEAELESFFEERQEDFRRPELRTLTYVLISPDAVAETIEVPEEEIADAYATRRNSFVQPERRELAQILFADETAARAAARALESTPANEIGAKADELGLTVIDLGMFDREAVPNEGLAEAAFGLEEPGVTDAFQGAFGWSVAIVRSIDPGSEPSLEEVREQLAADLALDRAYNEVFERGNLLEDGFGQGMSLEEAAESIGLDAQTVPAVDSSGRGPNGEALSGLPAGLSFLRTAFDLEEGEVSFLETTESDAMFMVRVDEIIPSRIPEFADVRDAVAEAWREEARFDAAETRAQSLADRLAEGGDPVLLAQMMDGEAGRVVSFARNGRGEEGGRIPAALAAQLYGLSPGETAFANDGERFVIGRLTEITPASEASDDAYRANIAQALAAGMAEDLIQQLGVALEGQFEINTYPEVYRQVYR
jgi:peptidyl-prolyl cis-trans isomerase D